MTQALPIAIDGCIPVYSVGVFEHHNIHIFAYPGGPRVMHNIDQGAFWTRRESSEKEFNLKFEKAIG